MSAIVFLWLVLVEHTPILHAAAMLGIALYLASVIMSSWISDAKRTPVLRVAASLGIVVGKECFQLCPYPDCARSRPLVRGQLPGHGGTGCLARDDYWTCCACGRGGDCVDLASLMLCQRRLRDCSPEEKARVREWFTGTRTSVTPTIVEATTDGATAPAPRYPDRAELKRLWTSCVRVDEDAGAAEYLRGRGIDPTDTADRDLARVIVADTYLPPWARAYEEGWRSWLASGHRMIVLLRDAYGTACSALARRFPAIPNDALKSTSPAGHKHKLERRGLVMTCSMARWVLRHGHPSQWPVDVGDASAPFGLNEPWCPADRPLDVMFVEGETDFCVAGTEWSDAAEFAPAVIGGVQGSWSPAIADRIPDLTRVWIATDHDDAGNKYAERIRDTFAGRQVELIRMELPR